MNMRLIGLNNEAANPGRAATALRRMTQEQLLNLGIHQVLYVRAGRGERGPLFQIHGADGTPLATVDELEDAVYLAAEQGFEFATIH